MEEEGSATDYGVLNCAKLLMYLKNKKIDSNLNDHIPANTEEKRRKKLQKKGLFPWPQPLKLRNLVEVEDDYMPPERPPVTSLFGLVGRCSKPFQKRLTHSDISAHLSRLMLRRPHVEKYMLDLLKEEEKENVTGFSFDLDVTTYDIEGKSYNMVFTMWSNGCFVLSKGWKSFCHDHDLRENQDSVTVWMFRHLVTDKVCFVIGSRRLHDSKPVKKRQGNIEEE